MKIDLHQLQLMMNHYLGRRGHGVSCRRRAKADVLLPRSHEMRDVDDVILCHSTCHTGTGLSHSAMIFEGGVRRIYYQVLNALDWAKWSSESLDMTFFAKEDVNGT